MNLLISRTKLTARKGGAKASPSKMKSKTLTPGEIKGALCALLDECKGCRNFASSGAYTGVPLPGLNLLGSGPTPLPLAERDALAIIKRQEEAKKGKK